MIITFRYPALVTTKARSAASGWRRIVSMTGQAEIPEFSKDDIPVAAIVSISGRDGGVPIRFHQGKLYWRSYETTFRSEEAGLDLAMGHAVCEYLLKERSHNVSLGASHGRSFWTLWEYSRDSLASRRYIPGFSDARWAEFKQFDPKKFDGDMLEHWAEVATEYVSSILSIDGYLWLPVDEPMMRSELISGRPTGPHEFVYDDASCYRNGYGRPSDMPKPYGSASFDPDAPHRLHPYWNPRCRYVSLPEAVALADSRTGWLADVLLPEAFTIDHATLQLDRAARVSAFCVSHIINDFSISSFDELATLQKVLKRVTIGCPGDQPSQDLCDVLEQFSDYLRSFDGKPHSALSGYLGSLNLRTLVDGALERWNDRPIELGNELNRNHIPGIGRV